MLQTVTTEWNKKEKPKNINKTSQIEESNKYSIHYNDITRKRGAKNPGQKIQRYGRQKQRTTSSPKRVGSPRVLENPPPHHSPSHLRPPLDQPPPVSPTTQKNVQLAAIDNNLVENLHLMKVVFKGVSPDRIKTSLQILNLILQRFVLILRWC